MSCLYLMKSSHFFISKKGSVIYKIAIARITHVCFRFFFTDIFPLFPIDTVLQVPVRYPDNLGPDLFSETDKMDIDDVKTPWRKVFKFGSWSMLIL
jgi:hypothetical protein